MPVRNKRRIVILFIAEGLLLIPFVAMKFTDEVNWTPFDFIVAGGLLFFAGLTYELVTRKGNNTMYRIAAGIAVTTALLLIWVNLAVGLIGSSPNPANVMYFGVVLVGITGAAAARLQHNGMAYALFGMALAQISVPLITLIFGKHLLEEPPGIAGAIMLNLFFGMLFLVSGLLFRSVSASTQIKNG